MNDEFRFSVFVLEKDVLEYNHFKAKYEEFDALSKTIKSSKNLNFFSS